MGQIIKYEDLDELLEKVGKEFYKKVIEIVEENRCDDYKYFNHAILKLGDGRKVIFKLHSYSGRGVAQISNYNWDDLRDDGYGDFFDVLPDSGYGFLVKVSIYNIGCDPIAYNYSEQDYPYNIELTEEKREIIKKYLSEVEQLIPSLQFDSEATYCVENLTYDAKKLYNINLFNKEMEKLHDENPNCNILPQVETAIDWWIERFTRYHIGGYVGDDVTSFVSYTLANKYFSNVSVNNEQIKIFKDYLTKKIMEELSEGNDVVLSVNYAPEGILSDAMTEAKMDYVKAPLKTRMVVGIDRVKVSEGSHTPYQDLFVLSPDEKKKYSK